MATGASRRKIIETIARDALGSGAGIRVEPVGGGRSTEVYRVGRGNEIFYLRILPEAGTTFESEVQVHHTLLGLGVRVPEVVYHDASNEQLRRSVMITTEIPGDSLAKTGIGLETQQVIFDAGRDLARINSLPVEGFGWIKRDSQRLSDHHLTAEHVTFHDFVFDPYDSLNEHLGFLEFYLFHERDIRAIREVVMRLEPEFATVSSNLAHGDFDTTHVFSHAGRYTGIIDFGEIRGTDQSYDLAHFRVHDEEYLPVKLLPRLLDGYRAESGISDDLDQQLAFLGLINAVRALGRNLKQYGVTRSGYQRHLDSSILRDLALLR